jgi:hypothetical protein
LKYLLGIYILDSIGWIVERVWKDIILGSQFTITHVTQIVFHLQQKQLVLKGEIGSYILDASAHDIEGISSEMR